MPTLQEIQIDRAAFTDELKAENERHDREKKRIAAALDELKRQEALLLDGLDVGKIALGRQVLEIRGKVSEVRHGAYSDQRRDGVRRKLLEDACGDLASGARRLRDRYFGVKNYEHFGDQRHESEYGMAPRYGSVVFSIGLTAEARKRDLTADEIESGLYLLATLEQQERALQSVAA